MQVTFIDRLKEKFKQIDPNSAYTSTLTVVASLLAQNGINIIYALIAVITAWHSAKTQKQKAEKELETLHLNNMKLQQEMELCRLEKEIELESKRMDLRERSRKANEV